MVDLGNSTGRISKAEIEGQNVENIKQVSGSEFVKGFRGGKKEEREVED